MKDYKNFKTYQPDDTTRQALQSKHGVIFFKSENGEDWYDVQKTFSPDTLKVAYDQDGIIRSISNDVSMLTPENLSVAEVENSEKNLNADIYGEWVYKSGTIYRRQYTSAELTQQAEEKKARLLASAEVIIAPLARAVRLGMATGDEIIMLNDWERYSVSVNRIDTSNVLDIDWPEPPTKQD